ncbi:MAG: hypothetical protein R2880_17785 [Deinococcales bacterium]
MKGADDEHEVIMTNEITFEQVFSLARQLHPKDQIRLIARLAPKVKWILEQVESTTLLPTHKPLRGLLADLGPAPSTEEIVEVQHELWGQTFINCKPHQSTQFSKRLYLNP